MMNYHLEMVKVIDTSKTINLATGEGSFWAEIELGFLRNIH